MREYIDKQWVQSCLARQGIYESVTEIALTPKQGEVNLSYRVETDASRYLLKKLTPVSSRTARFKAQFSAQQLAYETGLAPEPIGFDQKMGVWIERWIDSQTSSHSLAKMIHGAATCLASLHELPVNEHGGIYPVLNLINDWQEYTGAIPQPSDWINQQLSQLLPLWQQIDKQPKVLCHHDLSIANLLFLSDNIVFADWEYAALGNPLLDIAFCFEANQWSKEIEKRFCDAYSKHTDANRTNEVWEKVQLFRPLAIHTNRLWQRAAAKIRVQPE